MCFGCEDGGGGEMRGSEEAEGLAASQHEHMNPVYLAVHSHVVTSSLSPLTVFALKFD